MDFEELGEGESVLQHLIAGAAAGTAEHCGMYPIDTIKTHAQAFRPTHTSNAHLGVIKTAQAIVERHGVLGLFRGVSAVAAGAAPAHAMHFATYEFCKRHFGGNAEGHHPFSTGAAGVCATVTPQVVSDAILTPMDAVKQRLQLGVRSYAGVGDCLRAILRTEGIVPMTTTHPGPRALYASYTTTLWMNVPYNAFYFAAYESLRRLLKRKSEEEFEPLVHCLAGGGAGMTAAALTTPFDVAKTRLQTQGEMQGEGKYRGLRQTMLTIWREEGRQGYFRGLLPRMALHSTSAALCWMTYEWMKFFLASVGVGGK